MSVKPGLKGRKTIEIYFILYLAALILLIPGRENENKKLQENNSIFKLDFGIKSEKPTLNCIMSLDSNGAKILSLDSINHIYYTGEVKNVEFEFIIEDQLLRQKVSMTKADNDKSKFFKVDQNEMEQFASFHWMPKLLDYSNKSYLVQVIAKANVNQNGHEEVIRKTQFSLNITFVNQLDAIMATNNNPSLNPNPQINEMPLLIQSGNIIMIPQMDVIKTVAYSKWENTINISGLNPKTDLLKQPQVSIIKETKDGSGTATIKSYSDSWITLEGMAPSYGAMKVKISIARKSDAQEKTIEFKIENQMLGEPNLEKNMYPGFTYKINPSLPLLTMQTTKAILKIKDGSVISSSNEGAEFSYSPNIADTGKTIELIRMIDNHEIGQRYYARISNFPAPEIYRVVETDKDKVRLLTNSYGSHNGSENFITKIEILEGNARVREIFGSKQNSNSNFKYQQIFELVPSNSDQNLKFKARAVAANGQKSAIINYP